MREYKVGVLAFCLCIAVGLIMLVGIGSSLWFLRGVLDISSPLIEVGIAPEGLQAVSAVYTDLPDQAKLFLRVVYVRGERDEYLAGISRIKELGLLPNVLKEDGWDVERKGWITVAHRAEQSVSKGRYSLLRGVKTLWSAVWDKKLPVSPIAFIRGGGIAAVAKQEKHKTIIAFNGVEQEYVPFLGLDPHDKNRINKGYYVSLQREELERIPNILKEQLERFISDDLGFQKSNPQLLSFVGPGEYFLMGGDGVSIAFGVAGSQESFIQKASDAIQKEQSYLHPTKKAFRLPDGSIGYEYVPGPSEANFIRKEGNNDECITSDKYDDTLFICSKSGTSFLTKNQEFANSLLDKIQGARGTLDGEIQTDALKNLIPGDSFRSVLFFGTMQNLSIIFERK